MNLPHCDRWNEPASCISYWCCPTPAQNHTVGCPISFRERKLYTHYSWYRMGGPLEAGSCSLSHNACHLPDKTTVLNNYCSITIQDEGKWTNELVYKVFGDSRCHLSTIHVILQQPSPLNDGVCHMNGLWLHASPERLITMSVTWTYCDGAYHTNAICQGSNKILS